MTKNRSWVLVKRPIGLPKVTDWEEKEEELPELKEGEFLVKVHYISFDPTQRGWIQEITTYVEPVNIGEVMRAVGTGIVCESKNSNFVVGDEVSGLFGWQEYCLVAADEFQIRGMTVPPYFKNILRKLPKGTPLTMPLNLVGIVGFTAYFGLLEVAKLKEGDVVVVSGAAGATGSLVGQIAKLKGHRVIGITGGADKCKHIKGLGFDEAIDYKTEDVRKRLNELVPKGINFHFENVGGEILEAAIDNMAIKGNIIICGMISEYNNEKASSTGPRNFIHVITKRITISGFIVTDFIQQFESASKELLQWAKEGKIKASEDIQHGFHDIPKTFLRLFSGANIGKQLLQLP